MPFCPRCHSEYRPGFTSCVGCEVALVEALPHLDEQKSARLREAAAAGTASPIARSNYAEACQMVEVLRAAGVDAMVSPDPATCGAGGACSHYFALVLEEDLANAGAALKEEWRKLLHNEGELALSPDQQALDFDEEGERACPACGETFAGVVEECPECGLFLGAG